MTQNQPLSTASTHEPWLLKGFPRLSPRPRPDTAQLALRPNTAPPTPSASLRLERVDKAQLRHLAAPGRYQRDPGGCLETSWNSQRLDANRSPERKRSQRYRAMDMAFARQVQALREKHTNLYGEVNVNQFLQINPIEYNRLPYIVPQTKDIKGPIE